MEKAENIVAGLAEKFPSIDTQTARFSTRQIYLTLPRNVFLDALSYAKDSLGFSHLCTITGLDNGENFEFIYHMANTEGLTLSLRLVSNRGDGVTIPSVLPIFNGATFYEREVESLLGVRIEGLPAGRQYPLPDNWPKKQYPMRKDWVLPEGGVTPEPAEGEDSNG